MQSSTFLWSGNKRILGFINKKMKGNTRAIFGISLSKHLYLKKEIWCKQIPIYNYMESTTLIKC